MFDTAVYIQRRNQLKSKLSSGLALFLGNEESPMNYKENPYHFRQDSTFLYYFGLKDPGLVGVIDFDEGNEYLFGNDVTVEDIVWMGPLPTLRERAFAVGIESTGTITDLQVILDKACHKGRTIHYLPPYRSGNKLKLWQWLDIAPNKLQNQTSVDLIKSVVAQREVKSNEELAEIKKAVDTSVDMHITAMKMACPGMTELEIAATVQNIAVPSRWKYFFSHHSYCSWRNFA